MFEKLVEAYTEAHPKNPRIKIKLAYPETSTSNPIYIVSEAAKGLVSLYSSLASAYTMITPDNKGMLVYGVHISANLTGYRQGYGTLLIRAAEELATLKKCTYLVGVTNPSNRTAHANDLVISCGWKNIGPLFWNPVHASDSNDYLQLHGKVLNGN